MRSDTKNVDAVSLERKICFVKDETATELISSYFKYIFTILTYNKVLS